MDWCTDCPTDYPRTGYRCRTTDRTVVHTTVRMVDSRYDWDILLADVQHTDYRPDYRPTAVLVYRPTRQTEPTHRQAAI